MESPPASDPKNGYIAAGANAGKNARIASAESLFGPERAARRLLVRRELDSKSAVWRLMPASKRAFCDIARTSIMCLLQTMRS